jgi:hypothetical protein
MEYIIENITKEEYKILENSNINWFIDDTFGNSHDAVIEGEEEYNRALKLLNRV